MLTKEVSETKQALEESRNISIAKSQHLEVQRREFEYQRKTFENQRKYLKIIHAQALQKIKNAAAKIVFENRIKMYEEVSKEDFKLSSWDINGWKESLAKFPNDAGESDLINAIETKDPYIQEYNAGQDDKIT